VAATSGHLESSGTLLRAALKEAIGRMRDANVPSYTLAAELLLMHALGCDRAWLYSHPEAPLEGSVARKYFALVERRVAGEPTQYLTGKQEFWGLEFEVNPSVLIPRPETEHVVEVALERLGQKRSRQPLRVADVGTGSGCLAVALARELPQAEVFATDVSAGALEVAGRNAARHGVAHRIRFFESSLLEAFLADAPAGLGSQLGSQLDVIVSNPPYIGRGEADDLPREVREHEPGQALFSGEKGVEIYDPLIGQAAKLLAAGGCLVLELGYNSLNHVRPLLGASPHWTRVAVKNDLAGIPRVIAAERA
jgi:release factor glutamine methyltransferase